MDAESESKRRHEAIPPEITLEVADRFCPLLTNVSDSWRETLQELRPRFCEDARKYKELKCVLTHSVVPEWPERPDGPYPPEVDGMEPIAMGRGPSRWPQQYFLRNQEGTESVVTDLDPMSERSYRLRMLDVASQLELGDARYVPIVGHQVVQNVTGKPILFSDGQPVAMRQGIERNYFVHAGGQTHEQLKSITAFYSVAEQAGQCLYQLPTDVNRRLWRQWMDGFRAIGDKGMWISALFELAWQQERGDSFSAERYSWSGTTNIPLGPLPPATWPTKDGESSDSPHGIPDIPDEPSHWYSVIEDLASASVAAVDLLLGTDGECG